MGNHDVNRMSDGWCMDENKGERVSEEKLD